MNLKFSEKKQKLAQNWENNRGVLSAPEISLDELKALDQN